MLEKRSQTQNIEKNRGEQSGTERDRTDHTQGTTHRHRWREGVAYRCLKKSELWWQLPFVPTLAWWHLFNV